MPRNFASLILMGGQNKRMNGQHKAFLTLDQSTFLEKICSLLKNYGPVYLSVDDHTKFSFLSYPLIEDHYPHIGPMGGIASALSELKEDYLFVTACDMPLISKDLLDYMQDQLALLPPEKKGLALCDKEGFLYPLGAIYHRNILPEMLEMIYSNNYRLQYLLRHTDSVILSLSEAPFPPEVFSNINTPEDYKKINHSH